MINNPDKKLVRGDSYRYGTSNNNLTVPTAFQVAESLGVPLSPRVDHGRSEPNYISPCQQYRTRRRSCALFDSIHSHTPLNSSLKLACTVNGGRQALSSGNDEASPVLYDRGLAAVAPSCCSPSVPPLVLGPSSDARSPLAPPFWTPVVVEYFVASKLANRKTTTTTTTTYSARIVSYRSGPDSYDYTHGQVAMAAASSTKPVWNWICTNWWRPRQLFCWHRSDFGNSLKCLGVYNNDDDEHATNTR
jgi:hypothetical protein